MSALAQPTLGAPSRWPYGAPYNPVVAKGAADALPVSDAVVMVTATGVDAMTLALPKAGTYGLIPGGNALGEPADDGKRLLVYLTTAFIHTITTPTNGINGSKHLVTFTAVVGNFIEFLAFNGTWYVVAQLGATIT